MSVSTGTGKLNLALKTLLTRWEDTKARWKDPVGQAFEENYLIPLEKQIVITLREMDRLGFTMNQAERECS